MVCAMVGGLVCATCGGESRHFARGWIAIRCDDPRNGEPPQLAFYCPVCAEVGFGHDVRQRRLFSPTASVDHATQMTISAPRLVRAHGAVTYTGAVIGAHGGQVQLQSRTTKHPGWRTFALVAIGADGSFEYPANVAEPGIYRVRAVYPGDRSHQPSSATVTFKVV
jgi:hypothetical protein